MLFNRSLAEGKLPTDWRLANVTPVYKKGSKDTVKITVLSVLLPKSAKLLSLSLEMT